MMPAGARDLADVPVRSQYASKEAWLAAIRRTVRCFSLAQKSNDSLAEEEAVLVPMPRYAIPGSIMFQYCNTVQSLTAPPTSSQSTVLPRLASLWPLAPPSETSRRARASAHSARHEPSRVQYALRARRPHVR